jgi:hypothetical protein
MKPRLSCKRALNPSSLARDRRASISKGCVAYDLVVAATSRTFAVNCWVAEHCAIAGERFALKVF